MKQHHVWITSRNRRRTSFTGDHTFAAVRAELLRSSSVERLLETRCSRFKSCREAGRPAFHHFVHRSPQKPSSEAARPWDPSVTTGFDSQHPGDRDASLAVFLLRSFSNLFAAVKTGFLRSKTKLKCGCPEWGSAKAGFGFDSRRSQLEPVCYSPRFFSTHAANQRRTHFWGSQIRDTSTHNRLVAGSSPAGCLRAFVAQW